MNINRAKNSIGKLVRKLAVFRYRILGVRIGKNVFISHKAKIDTAYRGSVYFGDGCCLT